MNQAHWHLMLNHLPITGAALALILWLYSLWRNQADIYRFALGWAIVIGLMTLPVYWTGEQSHELLHGLADFNHDMVEIHELWGTYLLYAMLGTAVLALACLLTLKRSQGRPSKGWKAVIALAFLLTMGLGVYTGHLGGMVHHPEIRPGFASHSEKEVPEHIEHHHETQNHNS